MNCGVGKWGGWWPYCCRSWCIVVSTIGRTHGFLDLKDAGLPRKHRQYVGFLVRGVVEQLFVGAGVVRWGWWLWWLCSSMQARSWQIESCRHQEVHPAFGQVGWLVLCRPYDLVVPERLNRQKKGFVLCSSSLLARPRAVFDGFPGRPRKNRGTIFAR